MTPMRRLPYCKQQILSEDVEAVCKALQSELITSGPLVEEFEMRMSSLTGAKFAIACSNGTAALHLACRALGVGKNQLGVTSPITFLASANCFEFCGASSDFVDINPETLCLSVSALEEYCVNKRIPDVVIPVSFAGMVGELPEIFELAKRYGFKIIEDASHSIGSTYEFQDTQYWSGGCTHSDLATMSFHPVKNITTGEGGMILTNDPRLAERLRLLRNHGMVRDKNKMQSYEGGWSYEMFELGYNYRITDIQCALGISQLSRLAQKKSLRQKCVRRYCELFSNRPSVLQPPWPKREFPCQHLFPVQFIGDEGLRKHVYDSLVAKNVFPQVHYIPVYRQPYYREKYGDVRENFPFAEQYYKRCLSLPLFDEISDLEIEFVVQSVFEALESR